MALTKLRIAKTRQGLQQDTLGVAIFLFSTLSVLAQASLILTSSASLPPAIPLFYSKPWGEPMLASSLAIWLLPTICTVISLVNFSLALFVFRENQFILRVLF
ncbi:hypothetical protein HYW39_00660, partial [Candidatus Curtissbacteria bacterium]|nr:hypothetical protein [Candidatus Curtissbacteria bacterium]